MLKTDVCIVGAGPAGTVASMFLSKNKIPHILVDRAVFPREKVCGEFYDGRLHSVLKKIDPLFMDKMKEQNVIQDIREYSYFNTRLKELKVTIPVKTTARVSTNRFDFDTYLLNEALKSEYVQYFEDTNIADVVYTEGGVQLSDKKQSFQVEVEAAILATGAHSLLSQKMILNPASKEHFLLASRGYYENVAKTNNVDTLQIFLYKKPVPYYLCIVQLPKNLATVEIGILKKIAVKHHISPDDLLIDTVQNQPVVKDLFKNAKLVSNIKGTGLPRSSTKHKISTERILLAGSCGSNVNAITGWGVGHAVYEGMCAAEQYVSAKKANDFSAENFKNYDKRIHKALGNERFIGKVLDASLLYAYSIMDFTLSVVSSNKWLSRKASTIINGL